MVDGFNFEGLLTLDWYRWVYAWFRRDGVEHRYVKRRLWIRCRGPVSTSLSITKRDSLARDLDEKRIVNWYKKLGRKQIVLIYISDLLTKWQKLPKLEMGTKVPLLFKAEVLFQIPVVREKWQNLSSFDISLKILRNEIIFKTGPCS